MKIKLEVWNFGMRDFDDYTCFMGQIWKTNIYTYLQTAWFCMSVCDITLVASLSQELMYNI